MKQILIIGIGIGMVMFGLKGKYDAYYERKGDDNEEKCDEGKSENEAKSETIISEITKPMEDDHSNCGTWDWANCPDHENCPNH